MKRIGILSSKIAKENLILYNFYVLLFSGLFSLIIFFLSAFAVVVGLSLMLYLTKGTVAITSEVVFMKLFMTSLVVLVIIIGMMNLVAVLVNIKVRK